LYQILWLRGFRNHTISGRGFNLFKSLRRHFQATPRRDPGAETPRFKRSTISPGDFRRDGGAGANTARNLLSGLGVTSLLGHRRRIRQSLTKLDGAALLRVEASCRTGLLGTLGHGGFLVWRKALGQDTTICFPERKGSKISKAGFRPSDAGGG
jgi:hypothetical protein